MITVEKITKRLAALEPGESVLIRYPGSSEYDQMRSFYCTVYRAGEDGLASEYTFREFEGGGWLYTHDFETDSLEEITARVARYLDIPA